MSVIRVEMDLGDRVLSLETGKLAMQAHGAVIVQAGETMCLVTACIGEQPRETLDFFPLTVDYEEKLYAAGKIPGSFYRREGRPTEKAILTSRLADRGIRPLFPPGIRSEVQVIATALSADRENQIDILAMIGASAALAVSGIPFPVIPGSMRVALSPEDEWIVYPTHSESSDALLDLIVTSTREYITMVEAGALEVDEDTIAEGCQIAQEQCIRVIDLIEDLKRKVDPEPIEVPRYVPGEDVVSAVEEARAVERYSEAFRVTDRVAQRKMLDQIRDEIVAALSVRFGEDRKGEIAEACVRPMKQALREAILNEGRRPDGRGARDIRPLAAEVGISPRAHGSALFTRGQTQALAIATLGMLGEAQKQDGLTDDESKTFMHHYNMPPYSTGEAYPLRGPGRRAIGHGALAERSLRAVMPSTDEFPYSLRLVSEIVSSNGSTSMASVCAGSLALMDAGVPIRTPVAGMAMGIIHESPDRYCILTDIQGIEDHNGDMDFKVAGTRKGITALQLDVKACGLTPAILAEAMAQAREARLQVLDVMEQTLPCPRSELSKYAPRVQTIEIPVDKIGTVIGPGGKMIRKIEELGVQIDIEDDGRVYVASSDSEAAEAALRMIRNLVREPEVGEVFEDARVVKMLGDAAFVELLPGRDGRLHISEWAWEHTPDLKSVISVGDRIRVKVKEVDDQGRLNLTRKELLERPAGGGRERPPHTRSPERGGHSGHDRNRGPRSRGTGSSSGSGGVSYRDKH